MRVIGLPRPARSRALIGLLAAALVHGILLLVLLGQRDHQSGKPGARFLTELRLLAAPAEPEESARRPARRPTQGRSASLILPMQVPAVLPPSTAAPAPAISPGAVTATRAPLNLSLPPERAASAPRPESMLSQMLNDPRTRSLKRTVEFAVADAAGTLPVSIQSSTDGTQSTLIRQGSKCIRVAEARVKTLNPMDDNARGASSVVGPCFKD